LSFLTQRTSHCPDKNTADGLVKSSVCKAREPGKAEAYFLYVEGFHGERNAADGAFYEFVIIDTGIQPAQLNPSASTIKADGNFIPFNNHRDFAATVRIFQHGVQMLFTILDINIFCFNIFFRVSFTSCIGKRSC